MSTNEVINILGGLSSLIVSLGITYLIIKIGKAIEKFSGD